MALLFQRLARNFIKNGYFPTDSETLSRILSALRPSEQGNLRLLDPCCGEGIALAECKSHVGTHRATAYGIEIDEERAWHAKSLLDRSIHSDIKHCVIGQRRFGLLFLNPPYGDCVADTGETGELSGSGRRRLEKRFYSRVISSLQPGGVLVFIIPYSSLDKELSRWLAQQFERVQIFLAPEQRFKQVVIFGLRRSAKAPTVDIRQQLERVGQGELPPVLPEVWEDTPYTIPAATCDDVKFYSVAIEPKQLAEEIQRFQGLWPQFQARFMQEGQRAKPPLMALSSWHLALTLAAGQVSGVVTSKNGRTLLIKGDTVKTEVTTSHFDVLPNDNVLEIVTQIDKFVPMICALELTRHSPDFGRVFTIV